MSIASEISRLQQAKSDIRTAIRNKGVAVPEATSLDGYAELIDSITRSGSYFTTTATPSGNSSSITFTALPYSNVRAFFIITTTQITLGTTRYITAVMYSSKSYTATLGYRSGSTAYEYVLANSYISHTEENGNLTVTISQSGNTRYFKSGATYQIVCLF